jgi:hypothetical protein
MKKLVWVAGLLLLLSFVFPNGLPLPVSTPTTPEPVVVVPEGPTDATIVKLLTGAAPEDKARIVGVYSGLLNVLQRPKATELLTTTEKWALTQENTLKLAIDEPGKYPGLDEAIEGVFAAAVGTDDVVAVTPEIMKKLMEACTVVVNSATAAK